MLVKRKFVDGKPDHLAILHGPDNGGRQHFSPRLIERGAAEGWLSMGNGQIVLKTAEGEPDAAFEIKAGPGLYCCFCDAKLDSELDARTHVLDEHAKETGGKGSVELGIFDGEEKIRSGHVKSPDSNNPAGYRQDNFYATERVS